MNRRIKPATNEVLASEGAQDFAAQTRLSRMAFLTVIRDLVDTRSEMNTLLPNSGVQLLSHDAWLIRKYLEQMLRGAAALTVALRTDEAHAVLAAADLIIDLTRDEDLREMMAQALNDHERLVVQMSRDIEGLTSAEREALTKLLKREGI